MSLELLRKCDTITPMSATRTTVRKIEDLQVGDVVSFNVDEADEATATYFVMITLVRPMNEMFEVTFLVETTHDGVIESSFQGMDNQRVEVLV